MKLRKNRFVVLATFTSAAIVTSAHAQFIKANNNTSLNLAASYTANTTVPTSADTITFDNTLTTSTLTANLGGNLSVLGINANATPVSNVSRQWQIGNTTGATLTIGASGITKASNTSAFIISSAIALGADQTWTLNASTGTGTGNFQLNGTSFTDNGKTLAINGGGILDIRTTGSLTLGSVVTIDTSVSINGATATTDVTFGGSNTNNTLNIVAGKLSGSTIGNFGQASNFGDGGTNTAIALGGGAAGQNGLMVYTGNTNSSNRTVTRDGRSVASGIEVTTAGQTLTISGNLSSGSQVSALGSGWAFSGAGNLALNGVINNSTGGGSSGTTITKTGAGTLILGNATNSYSGATNVNDGKLVVNGNISTSSLTTVAVGATLGGAGTVGKTTVNGTLAIGNSPGTMTFTNTLGLNGIAVLEIDGTAGAGVTGGHDFANLTGSGAAGVLTYGGSMTLDMGVIFGMGSYSWNLFDMASETETFAAITLADQYSGSLLDGDLNGVWDLTSGDNTWQFTESTGVLGLTVIPEPRVALLGGLGILALLRRRRA